MNQTTYIRTQEGTKLFDTTSRVLEDSLEFNQKYLLQEKKLKSLKEINP